MTDAGLSGMSEMLKRLGQIEETCLGARTDGGSAPDKMDKFLQTKYFITNDLTDMKMKIHERFLQQKANGASVEVITLTSQIRHLDAEITKNFDKLKEVYRKQCDGSFFVFSRASSDQKELSARYAQLDQLAHQIEEARKAFRTNNDSEDVEGPARSKLLAGKTSPSALKRGSKSSVGDVATGPKQFREGEMDEFETDAVSRWQDAEREMDKGVQEVGNVVDRLRPIADEIGLQAQKQDKMMSLIKERAEKTSTGIRQVSIRIRQIMDTERKSTFVCRVLLVLVLIGLGVWIYERAKARVSKTTPKS